MRLLPARVVRPSRGFLSRVAARVGGVTAVWLVSVLAASPAALGRAAPQDDPAPAAAGLPLEGPAAEEFLRSARVVSRARIGGSVTHPERFTLTDGTRTQRAIWKTVDRHRMGLQQLEGGVEFDFRDSWRHEVAAYELDKLLGLGLVPPTVERKIDGQAGSLQLWVEGAMSEQDRRKKGLVAPAVEAWNAAMYRVRLLHQLTRNTDYRNPQNVLVDTSFRIYAIDSSRAFRIQDELLDPGDLLRFSRVTLEKLAALDRPTLDERLGRWLDRTQIEGLLGRRDRILALAKKLVAEKGEGAVLY